MWSAALVALFLVLLVVLLALDARKPADFPPGPQWIPVFGNYFMFSRLYAKIGFSHLVWDFLSKTYGPLLGLRLGKDRLVVATGPEVLREILTREEFDARPDGYFFRLRAFGGRYGLVFVDGEFFNQQKKFVLKHLKFFGLNRSSMENKISLETGELIQTILKSPKGSVRLPEAVEVSVLNSLWAMLAGERFRLDDPKARALLEQIHASFRLQDMTGGSINQLPFLRFLLPQVNASFNKLTLILCSLVTFIQDLIHEHRKTLSPYENRDLIDAFINEMNKHENGSSFTEKQLIMLIMDLILAGSETTSSTLGFAILYLMHYPDIQKKLQEELDSVVGRRNQPHLLHRNSLVYFEAFICEVQRIANVSPTTVSHRAKEDAIVQGYRIPKDTIVLGNLYSLHMDKEHWMDPENFRPERFINSKGQLIHDDQLIPFGLGKRRCMGETLARTSIFLFLSSLVHTFVVSGKADVPLPPIEAQDGATLQPLSFEAVFTPRD